MNLFFEPSEWPLWLRRVSVVAFPIFWPLYVAACVMVVLLEGVAACILIPSGWLYSMWEDRS